MRHRANADFMRRAAKVKEAGSVRGSHQHIAGDAVESKPPEISDSTSSRANRETANTFITPLDQQQAIIFHLPDAPSHPGSELHARRSTR